MDLSRRQTFGAAFGAAALAFDPLISHAQIPSAPSVQIDLIASMRVVSVKSFGAVGDGVSDDSAALNAAINYIRNASMPAIYAHFGWRLDFPSGQYCVYSSINLSKIQNHIMTLSGNGSVIIGKCDGKPIIDAFSSRSITIRDLNIIGDSIMIPSIGIQIGIVNKTDISNNYVFDNVKTTGSFSITCIYNRGAENSSFYHNWAWNNNPNAHCLIQDGVDYFNVKSDFVKGALSGTSNIKSDGNLFLNCDFRSLGGCPVWIGDTSNLTFLRCYAATTGNNIFILFSGSNGNNAISFDCHCETVSLKSVFLIDGTSPYVNINNFDYVDHEPFATDSIFASSSNIIHTTIKNGSIKIGVFASSKCKVFDDRKKWSFSGSYYSAESPEDSLRNEISGQVTIGFNTFQGLAN